MVTVKENLNEKEDIQNDFTVSYDTPVNLPCSKQAWK